jgi:hypothetical protein
MLNYKSIQSFFKKRAFLVAIFFPLFLFGGMLTSCSGPKTGCPINEKAKVKTNRKGELSRKKGKSSLFPKKVRKKMKTH